MGRIKTKLIKRITMQIIKQHKDSLKDNFDDNKEIIGKVTNIESKKIRNAIAGYVTRVLKNKEEV